MYARLVSHFYTKMTKLMDELSESPRQLSDCCAGISKPLIHLLVDRLQRGPGRILSVGCGAGRLEATLIEASGSLDLYGVEVPSCATKHLPDDRILRVTGTTSVHASAQSASTLMFIYPRDPSLVAKYIAAGVNGGMKQVMWLGHRSDWPDFEPAMVENTGEVELIDGRGIAPYELLVVWKMI